MDYDGTPVEYWKELGIELDLTAIGAAGGGSDAVPGGLQASSSTTGEAFPEWQDHLIVGNLKATELHRIVVDGDRHVHTEILLENLAETWNEAPGAWSICCSNIGPGSQIGGRGQV